MWSSKAALRSFPELWNIIVGECDCGLCRLNSSHPIALVGHYSRESLESPASALPVMRLLETYGFWYCSCNPQLTQLEGNLSNLIDVMIDSLRVLIDEFVAIDFDSLGRWRVSLLIGLCNQLGLSLQSLTSIGCTYQASLLLQSVAVKSGWFCVLSCHNISLAAWPLDSNRNCQCYS